MTTTPTADRDARLPDPAAVAGQAAALLAAVASTATAGRMEQVLFAVLDRAEGGDVAAAKLLFDVVGATVRLPAGE